MRGELGSAFGQLRDCEHDLLTADRVAAVLQSLTDRESEFVARAPAMNGKFKTRDNGLTGPSNRVAKEHGLANADWHRPEQRRSIIKDLLTRRHVPAIHDTAIWLASLLAAARPFG